MVCSVFPLFLERLLTPLKVVRGARLTRSSPPTGPIKHSNIFLGDADKYHSRYSIAIYGSRVAAGFLPTVALMSLASTCTMGAIPVRAQSNNREVGVQSYEPVREWPRKAKRFALIVGVNQYIDNQITNLGGSVNDAQIIAKALVQYAGFPTDQVIVLSSDQPAERQPTRGNILRRLSNMAAAVPKDGLLLFAFAGHGIERGGRAFLLPTDAQVSNDLDLLELTAINVMQVNERIRKTGVGQVVLILDACRNDPAGGRSDTDNTLTPAYLRGFNFDVRNSEITAFATLYATEVGHRAYENKERKQGYFTWALVEGFKGRAANEKGEVTLAGLVKHLQEQVPKRVLLDLGLGKTQRPFAIVEGYKADELVISAPVPISAPEMANSASANAPPQVGAKTTAKAPLAKETNPGIGMGSRRPALGLQVQDVTPYIARNVGRADARGAIVIIVEPGSPAGRAGIRRGDVITAFNGASVNDSNGLRLLLGHLRLGAEAMLTILRAGILHQIPIFISESP